MKFISCALCGKKVNKKHTKKVRLNAREAFRVCRGCVKEAYANDRKEKDENR